MRVLQVTPVYPPYKGGMGAVAARYAQELRARNIDAHVLTPDYGTDSEDPSYVHRIKGLFSVGNASAVPHAFFRLKDFDIVHVHYPFFGFAELIPIAAQFPNTPPIVGTFHMNAIASGMKGMLFDLQRTFWQPTILKSFTTLFVSSQDYADQMGITKGIKDRLVENPFGIDTNRFHPASLEEKKKIRKTLGIELDLYTLVFVGGLDEPHAFKGLSVLIEALSKLTTPYQLLVIGDGDKRVQYESEAKQLSVSAHFLGRVSDDVLARSYRAADVHVFPSTSSAEAFGLVALEAAASGIPTIASDLPGVRTVVKHNETGFLCEPRNVIDLAARIERLGRDLELRQSLGSAARKRVETSYSWDAHMEKIIDVYNALV